MSDSTSDRLTDHASDQPSDRTLDKTPGLEVTDATRRRRFLRGGAMLLAAAPLMRSGDVLAGDCDRAGSATAEQKQQAGAAGSDSDTGAGSDPIGCGRYRDERPKISQADELPPTARTVRG